MFWHRSTTKENSNIGIGRNNSWVGNYSLGCITDIFLGLEDHRNPLCFFGLRWFFLILRLLQAEVRLFGQSPSQNSNWDCHCCASSISISWFTTTGHRQLCEIPKMQSDIFWIVLSEDVTGLSPHRWCCFQHCLSFRGESAASPLLSDSKICCSLNYLEQRHLFMFNQCTCRFLVGSRLYLFLLDLGTISSCSL